MSKTKHATTQSSPSPLDEYRQKRDFSKTAEPSGSSGSAKHASTLAFVVQKHAASQLHFDFRLELDGVMKSWAIPKGPSLDPTVKRLAVQVEDHPIDYNVFEGTIPAGEYGGGTVMVWDSGTYGPDRAATSGATDDRADDDILRDAFDRGDLKFVLHGERLRGSWVLVRTRFGRGASRGKPQWLLIKHRDAFAVPDSDIVADIQTSLATGRSMEEIAAAGRDEGGAIAATAGDAVAAGSPEDAAQAPSKSTARRRPGGRARGTS
jgi:bifunctional non-homologous end joining protein LigD